MDPNQRNADGRTLLHQSILDEDTGKVERLLLAGADVEEALEKAQALTNDAMEAAGYR